MTFLFSFSFSFLLWLFFVMSQSCIAEDQTEGATNKGLDNISTIMENARKDGEKMNLPVNKHETEGLRAAQQTSAIFHSTAFQKRVENAQQRLAKGIFKTSTKPWQKEKERFSQEPAAIFSEKETIYLFLSSSVPVETIHAYLATIASVGAPNVIPVMFGLVNGLAEVKASTKFYNRIVQEDLTCRDVMHPQKLCQRFELEIKVNPTLFTKYGITQVPAVVYESETDAFVIEGDAGLTYLLERINREAKSPSLATFIKTIQSTN